MVDAARRKIARRNEAIRANNRKCLNAVPHAISVRIPAICESRIIATARIFIGVAETRAHLSHVKGPIVPKIGEPPATSASLMAIERLLVAYIKCSAIPSFFELYFDPLT